MQTAMCGAVDVTAVARNWFPGLCYASYGGSYIMAPVPADEVLRLLASRPLPAPSRRLTLAQAVLPSHVE